MDEQYYMNQSGAPAQSGQMPETESGTYIGALSPVSREPDSAEEDKMYSAYKRAGFGSLAFFQVYQTVASFLLMAGVIVFAVQIVLIPYLRGERLPEISLYNYYDRILEFVQRPEALIVTLAYALGSAVGMTAAIFIFKLILSKRHFEAIPKRDLTGGQFWIVVLCAFSIWGIGVYLGNFPSLLFPVPSDFMTDLLEALGLKALPLHVYAIFGAPVFEELALRKVLLDRTHKYGGLPAAVVSGLLFGLIHGNSGQFIFAFFLGMIFAAVYLYTGKIFYTILLHFMINFTATVPELLYLAGFDISLYFYVALAVVAVVGLPFAIIAFRKNEVFKPSPAVFDRPARLVIKNPGMLTAVIFFSVSLESFSPL